MTDTSKGKVASLTGSLLARKGTATPAGLTRVLAGEIDTPAPIEATITADEANHDQPSLNLGAGPSEDRDGRGEESWAPLSQIVIQPHSFTSEDFAPAPEAIAPVGDIGIEPSLLVDQAHLLRATPPEGGRGEGIIVETPLVPPVLHPDEPILVVPRVQHDPGGEDGAGARTEAEQSEYEELAAPTLGPAVRDWAPDQEVPDDAAAATVHLDTPLGSRERPASEPYLAVRAEAPADSLDEPPIKGSEEKDLPEALPKSAPVLAPVVATRTTSRPEAAKPVVVPPIRIGELQARARDPGPQTAAAANQASSFCHTGVGDISWGDLASLSNESRWRRHCGQCGRGRGTDDLGYRR